MTAARGWGIVALVLGVSMIVGGLVVRLVVYPGLARFPDDVDTTRTYAGELGVLLNAEALASGDLESVFVRNLPVTIDRTVQTVETGGDNGAIVTDESVMSGPDGTIADSVDVYAIDRSSMEAIDNFSDDGRVADREGLVVGWPIGTEGTEYTGWNGDTQSTVALAFEGEEQRGGIDTYRFRAMADYAPIVDEETLEAFPAALPKDVLGGIAPALGLPADATEQLTALLPNLPDPVPLAYLYAFDKVYWVEPTTGILIDVDVMESRVGALAVPDQEPVPFTEVQNLAYTSTPESVEAAVDDADAAMGAIGLLGTWLPLGLAIVGVLLLIVGVVLVVRRPRWEEPDGADEETAV